MSVFPDTIDSFTNPVGTNTLDDPDHALQHSDANDAIEAIEAVIGTTAGTSVLKDFSAGEFPVRQEGGTLTQTLTGGTINATTLGTPTVTGGSFASPTTTGTDAGTATLTNKTLTSPVMTSPTFQGSIDGWVSVNETWTYASATTITVASGAASRFQKGDKLKLTNNSVKYFYIVGVADTLLTITGGTTHTLVSAAITSPYLSRIENPFGFPTWFAYAPTVISGSGTLTTASATGKFSLKGQMCHLQVAATITDKGTGGTDIRVAMPISASTGVGTVAGCGSSFNTFIALAVNLTTAGVLNIRKYDNTFYADNGQVLNAAITYQIS